MECLPRFLKRGRAYLLVICLQFGYAGNAILSKSALNKGMDKRPKMTASIFLKIMVLGLLEPVLDQNLYYTGMKYTSAAFAATMCNVMPAVAFIMAWILRLEKVDLRKRHSQAKVLGTIVTVGGAMIMTLLSGPSLKLPGSREHHNAATNVVHQENPLKGAILMACGCFCWASFVILQVRFSLLMATSHYTCTHFPTLVKGSSLTISRKLLPNMMQLFHRLRHFSKISFTKNKYAKFLIFPRLDVQAITLKSYPAELSLTALICMMGTIEGSMLAFAMEGRNPAVWAVHFDTKLAATLYSGTICSGLGFFISGLIMKEKGPVFVTTFNPLNMVIVTILGFFILSERLYLGRIIGAIIIVAGLYLVIWGKKKDPSTSKPNCHNRDRIVPSDLPVVVEKKAVESKNLETLNQNGVAVEVTKIGLPTK
ncbi:EamA domain [Dillenia turbinata]|uniref:EamA domain n=1 Tax=Dillenia turbinata TaxID=194707 RepID=A0AAN8VPC0_9MAGN